MRTRTEAPAAGITVPKVRPHWGTVLSAALVALLLAHPAGMGVAMIAGLLVLVISPAYQAVALLGYIAGALTPDEDDEAEDGAHV